MSAVRSIFVVDDDPGHVRLIEKNLRRSGLSATLETFSGGADVLARIYSGGPDVMVPSLMLLDLNMPGLSGQQVLLRMKSDARTRCVPIIVFTTTDDPGEIRNCYELGANLYLTKSTDYDAFVETVRALGELFQLIGTSE